MGFSAEEIADLEAQAGAETNENYKTMQKELKDTNK